MFFSKKSDNTNHSYALQTKVRALGIAQPNNHHQTGGSLSGSPGSSKLADNGTITLPKPILGGGSGGTSSSNNGGNLAAGSLGGNGTGGCNESSAQDTIYLCNFRVSVDGEWLCLKELQDLDIKDGTPGLGGGSGNGNNGGGGSSGFSGNGDGDGSLNTFGIIENVKCEEKIIERDWVNYYCRCYLWILLFVLLFYFW